MRLCLAAGPSGVGQHVLRQDFLRWCHIVSLECELFVLLFFCLTPRVNTSRPVVDVTIQRLRFYVISPEASTESKRPESAMNSLLLVRMFARVVDLD